MNRCLSKKTRWTFPCDHIFICELGWLLKRPWSICSSAVSSSDIKLLCPYICWSHSLIALFLLLLLHFVQYVLPNCRGPREPCSSVNFCYEFNQPHSPDYLTFTVLSLCISVDVVDLASRREGVILVNIIDITMGLSWSGIRRFWEWICKFCFLLSYCLEFSLLVILWNIWESSCTGFLIR